jgi:hypothetical protein
MRRDRIAGAAAFGPPLAWHFKELHNEYTEAGTDWVSRTKVWAIWKNEVV